MVVESVGYENTDRGSIAMSMDNRYDANPCGGDEKETSRPLSSSMAVMNASTPEEVMVRAYEIDDSRDLPVS